MKKTIKYSSLIIASLLFANCGGGGSTTQTPDTNNTTPTPDQNETNTTTPETKELTLSPLAPEVSINEGELYTVPTLTISGDGPFATTYHTQNDYGKIAVEAGQQLTIDQNTTLTATATELGGNHQTLAVEQKIIFVPADAPDADGDGVLDNDLCPNTTPGDKVDADGCNAETDFSGLTTFAFGPAKGLEGEIVDADGVVKVETVYSDGFGARTYSNGIVDNEAVHDIPVDYNITVTDGLGNVKVKSGTLE